jgi:hypothetical protein
MSEQLFNPGRPSRRRFLARAGAASAAAAGSMTSILNATPEGTPAAPHPAVAEPNMETALGWWSELPNKWTPVGWKDHLFRFNVLFNGTIMADPAPVSGGLSPNRRTEAWKGQGVQLEFIPSADGGGFRYFPAQDDGRVVQGWNESQAPVLRSDWTWPGLFMRQEVFGHIPGAEAIETGIEPLFAWIRLSIVDAIEGLPLEQKYGFALRLNAPHIFRTMSMRNNLIYDADKSQYPRPLSPENEEYSATAGYRLLESDGKVRLGVAPGQQCVVRFTPKQPAERDSLLFVQLDVRKGACVDLLLPMLPTDRAVFDQELALGYDRALQEANRYWSKAPAEAAQIETPEVHVNQAIRHSLKLAEVIAERDPATGSYSLLSGSWTYAEVWATPTAMACQFVLNSLGYHAAVEKYLQVFRRTQGSVVPPGKVFNLHPGYLATPKSLTAINWLTDHGALLWAISEHVLMSGNPEYVEEWTPVVLKACEFIKDARRMEGHGGVAGIMPPGVATDARTQIQGVWTDGWNYKGLSTAVKLLEQIKHARAAEFAAEARAYREAFTNALRQRTATMPTWKDSRGRTHHLVPVSLYGETKAETRHAFYLDTGPLFLVFAGLLDAGDEMMQSTLLWFREGPPTKAYRYDSNCWQVPSLVHEMSSCEPCYSWNLFHSHQTGDRARFIEGMYSEFAGGMSRQTFTMCETRGGITGLLPCLPSFYGVRLAVLDDQVAPQELHLLRLVPLAWLRKERKLVFTNAPTIFGRVSLSAKLDQTGKGLELTCDAKYRTKPRRVVLHVPPVSGLERITLNGKALNWDGKARTIAIA